MNSTDVALEKASIAACEAGHHAWPSTDGYNDRAEKRAFREIAKAAIEAYQAALPKGELAERLLKHADGIESISRKSGGPGPRSEEFIRDIRAAASLLGGDVPEGYVLVPKEPTRDQWISFCEIVFRNVDYLPRDVVLAVITEGHKALHRIAARPPESGRE